MHGTHLGASEISSFDLNGFNQSIQVENNFVRYLLTKEGSHCANLVIRQQCMTVMCKNGSYIMTSAGTFIIIYDKSQRC